MLLCFTVAQMSWRWDGRMDRHGLSAASRCAPTSESFTLQTVLFILPALPREKYICQFYLMPKVCSGWGALIPHTEKYIWC